MKWAQKIWNKIKKRLHTEKFAVMHPALLEIGIVAARMVVTAGGSSAATTAIVAGTRRRRMTIVLVADATGHDRRRTPRVLALHGHPTQRVMAHRPHPLVVFRCAGMRRRRRRRIRIAQIQRHFRVRRRSGLHQIPAPVDGAADVGGRSPARAATAVAVRSAGVPRRDIRTAHHLLLLNQARLDFLRFHGLDGLDHVLHQGAGAEPFAPVAVGALHGQQFDLVRDDGQCRRRHRGCRGDGLCQWVVFVAGALRRGLEDNFRLTGVVEGSGFQREYRAGGGEGKVGGSGRVDGGAGGGGRLVAAQKVVVFASAGPAGFTVEVVEELVAEFSDRREEILVQFGFNEDLQE